MRQRYVHWLAPVRQARRENPHAWRCRLKLSTEGNGSEARSSGTISSKRVRLAAVVSTLRAVKLNSGGSHKSRRVIIISNRRYLLSNLDITWEACRIKSSIEHIPDQIVTYRGRCSGRLPR